VFSVLWALFRLVAVSASPARAAGGPWTLASRGSTRIGKSIPPSNRPIQSGRPAGTKRRVAAAQPRHAGRGHGRTQQPTQRGAASPNSTQGNLTDCHLKHAEIYTTLTDATRRLAPG